MQPIQPINAGSASPIRPTNSAGVADVRSQGSSNAVSITSTSSTTTISINQQVESLLMSIDPALANNEYLKLLIAALILQFLLGDENSMQQTGQAGLQALETLSGGRQNALYLSIESATNTVQIEQQSSRLDVVGAVQTLSDASESDARPGGQVDVSG